MSDPDPAIDATLEPTGGSAPDTQAPIDLDEIERDLRDVESALARLADGTYFPQPAAAAEEVAG
jgi:hypothetical protein